MSAPESCQSCKAERAAKKPALPPAELITLPAGTTDGRNFRKPDVLVRVCSHCDGETLIASARRAFQGREEAE